MSFVQPFLLAALPLVALPVIIHLIHQRRFQTIRWGAMQFLVAAHRVSRGTAHLRNWLVLLVRMAAVAGLIFAVSRPLASGWLGRAAGGRADTTIILLDRSPSMSLRPAGSARSKLDTGRQQLARTLALRKSTRWVLIDGATHTPREINAPAALLNLPVTEPASTSADLPAMLQAAYNDLQGHPSARAEIWICSDLRENDWQPSSHRWHTLREQFREFGSGVRFHLLAFPQTETGNRAIRVSDVRTQQLGEAVELLLSLKVTQSLTANADAAPREIPVVFDLAGARSEVTVSLSGPEFSLLEHRLPLDVQHRRGWGKVSIAADANPADNEFYFVFEPPPPRRTVLVTDDPASSRVLHLAAAIAPHSSAQQPVDVVTPERVATVSWDGVALVLWHAPLPTGDEAAALRALVDRGGRVVFFPPRQFGREDFAGVAWSRWIELPIDVAVERWRGDQDVLAHTQSGTALPLGDLTIRRFCELRGAHTPLASLPGGDALVARVDTIPGGVYFCTTTPAAADSSLAANGVVLYVFVQRALADGAARLGHTRQLVAGDLSAVEPEHWHRMDGVAHALSTEFVHHAGAYTQGETLLAVNRDAAEDHAAILDDRRLAELFQGLTVHRVEGPAGTPSEEIREIWRLFQMLMMAALVVEAVLCLPRIAPPSLPGLPQRHA